MSNLPRRLLRAERVLAQRPAVPPPGVPHRRIGATCPECSLWWTPHYRFAGNRQLLTDLNWDASGRPERCSRCGWQPEVVECAFTVAELIEAARAGADPYLAADLAHLADLFDRRTGGAS